jgi:hypothetical protein
LALEVEGYIDIVTIESHNVGDPVSFGVILIKSMEGPPARAEIDVRCCRATRRRPDFESSIRRRDRRRIIREWALHREDEIFGTDKGHKRSDPDSNLCGNHKEIRHEFDLPLNGAFAYLQQNP